LPRRLKDLRDIGYSISETWVMIDGRKSHKVWFMSIEDKVSALTNLLKKVAA
jgi:hypothetical protein